MNENKEETVVRRRRKILRHQREKTPEPTAKTGIKIKYSDDESSSAAERGTDEPRQSPRLFVSSRPSSHRSKILSRRDKGSNTAAIRSQSTPRNEQNKDIQIDVVPVVRPPRSLSSPRYKEIPLECRTETSDKTEEKPAEQTSKRDEENPVKPTETKKTNQLQLNIKRFEEERKKFELEKKKFEIEKCEMNRTRFQRLVDFERKRAERKLAAEQNEHETLYKVCGLIAEDKDSKVQPDKASAKKTTKEQLGQIEKLPMPDKTSHAKPIKPARKKRSDSLNGLSDDYESSTAMSSSSREGDFDDIDEEFIKNEKVILTSDLLDSPTTIPDTILPPKTCWWSKIGVLSKQETHRNFLEFTQLKPIQMLKNKEIRKSLYHLITVDMKIQWKEMIRNHPDDWKHIKRLRNRCITNLIILAIFCGIGGIIFRFVEGAFENFYKCGVRRVKRDFVDSLWLSSHNLREDDWKTLARGKLRQFEEELHAAYEAGTTSYSGQKAWSFINSVNYCMTVITTIGYGHISPSTNTGRAITMVYAIIGIPIFLILLADFGKLFTRGIKVLWRYVRRLYYTGSCRQMRKQAQLQGVIKGVNMAYDMATFKKGPDEKDVEQSANESQTNPDSPTIEEVEIDINDEFNLPISLALFILLAYIFAGAAVYSMWEEWSFFESCYFVFISMSTIGFGDYVPKHPIFMMTSIVYLVFGLALTSMCINVVQLKLSDSFRQASAKIGATIGLTMAEEEARNSQNQTPESTDMPEVHKSPTETIDKHDDPPPPPLLPRKPTTLAIENKTQENPKNDKSGKSKK